MDADFGNIKTSDLGLFFQSYDITAPEIQEHKLSVPGRDGDIDLSEVSGKVTYRNRAVTLYLFDWRKLEARKAARAKLLTAIHGKSRELIISDAPEYTIRGRWRVEATEEGQITRYVVTGDCYPFRYRGTVTYLINAAGGIALELPSGDQAVTPTIEVQRKALVTFEGKAYWLEPGTWKIRDIYFKGGTNRVIINTYPEYSGGAKWTDYTGKTWKELEGKRWSELAAGDEPINIPAKWTEYEGLRWSELAGKKWVELAHPAQPGDEYSVYIQYDWSDF